MRIESFADPSQEICQTCSKKKEKKDRQVGGADVTSSYKGIAKVLTLRPPKDVNIIDFEGFYLAKVPAVRDVIMTKMPQQPGVRFYISTSIAFVRIDESGEVDVHTEASFRSPVYTHNGIASMRQAAVIQGHLMSARDELTNQLEQFTKEGSNWTIDKVLTLNVHLTAYVPLAAAAPVSIPLPGWLTYKKSLINVAAPDNKCFLFAVAAGLRSHEELKHPERHTQYGSLVTGFNVRGLTFPMDFKNVGAFERMNAEISVSIFWCDNENKQICPLRIADPVREKHVQLLLIEDKNIKHYVCIRSLDLLLNYRTKSHVQMHYCEYCLHGFVDAAVRAEHMEFCRQHDAQRIRMPTKERSKLEFTNYKKIEKAPFVLFADFESYLNPCDRLKGNATRVYQDHVASGYCINLVPRNPEIWTGKQTLYTFNGVGKEVSTHFLKTLESISNEVNTVLGNVKPLAMSERDEIAFAAAVFCRACGTELKHDRVRDHDHTTGAFRGACHNKCNLQMTFSTSKRGFAKKRRRDQSGLTPCRKRARNSFLLDETMEVDDGDDDDAVESNNAEEEEEEEKERVLHGVEEDDEDEDVERKTAFTGKRHYDQYRIPCFLHNARGYDNNLILQSAAGICREMKVLANNMEKYITLQLDNVQIIDSLSFLNGSLSAVVSSMLPDQLKQTASCFPDPEKFALMTRKGCYPYEYMTGPEKMAETALPPIEAFFSTLTGEGVSAEDYAHAQKVWSTFQMRTMQDYHDLYLQTDVLLLSDAFESFRDLMIGEFKLDPANYLTLSGYGWDAMMLFTKMKVDLLTDPDMYLMLESNIRGGICGVSKNFASANNRYVPDTYDPSKPDTYLLYLDACNLYGMALSKPLPQSNFKFVQNVDLDKILATPVDSPVGYFVEADVEYPESLHDAHSGFPLAPENMTITPEMLSPYTRELASCLNRTPSDAHKLTSTLFTKEKYLVHYTNLQTYVRLGLCVTRVHRVVEFHQSAYIKPYIDRCTALRQASTSDFGSNMIKFLANSIFGRSLMNVRKHQNVLLSNRRKYTLKKLSSPLYRGFKIFSNDLIAVHCLKSSIVLAHPIFIGFTVLETSKQHMYDFYYRTLVDGIFVGSTSCQYIYGDTDSLILEIESTEDVYEVMKSNSTHFDMSSYPRNTPYFDPVNKKVPGKFKDELAGQFPSVIKEVVALRPKAYSILVSDGETKSACKGVNRAVIKTLKHERFRAVQESRVNHVATMNRIQAFGHNLCTMEVNKIALSCYEDKRFYLNSTTSRPYGHYANESEPGDIVLA